MVAWLLVLATVEDEKALARIAWKKRSSAAAQVAARIQQALALRNRTKDTVRDGRFDSGRNPATDSAAATRAAALDAARYERGVAIAKARGSSVQAAELGPQHHQSATVPCLTQADLGLCNTSRNAHGVHYVRVAKTGSTALMLALQQARSRSVDCARQLILHTMHEVTASHVEKATHSRGDAPPTTFSALREPCARFASTFHFMRRSFTEASPDAPPPKYCKKSQEALVRSLSPLALWLTLCPMLGPAC
jgi:hypothetical protein